jgi:tRNA(fMet)-specific endonuclease VapC
MTRIYVLDTNHVGAAINPVSRLRDRMIQEHRPGARFRTCVPVLCELDIGIQDSGKAESFRRQLKILLKTMKLVPLESAIAQEYGLIFRELRSKGRVLSQIDILLAALVRGSDWTLLTADRDFQALPTLRVENWLP